MKTSSLTLFLGLAFAAALQPDAGAQTYVETDRAYSYINSQYLRRYISPSEFRAVSDESENCIRVGEGYSRVQVQYVPERRAVRYYSYWPASVYDYDARCRLVNRLSERGSGRIYTSVDDYGNITAYEYVPVNDYFDPESYRSSLRRFYGTVQYAVTGAVEDTNGVRYSSSTFSEAPSVRVPRSERGFYEDEGVRVRRVRPEADDTAFSFE